MVSAVSLEAVAQQRSNVSNHKRRAQDHIAMDTLEKRPRGEIVQQSLPAWGFHTSIGGRPYQEDAYLHAELQLPANFPLTTCFGVFDGHGGPAVSNHLSQNAASYISEALRSAQSPEAALKLAFTSLDSALPNDSKDLGGSTATVCLVSEDQIICANCGEFSADNFGSLIICFVDERTSLIINCLRLAADLLAVCAFMSSQVTRELCLLVAVKLSPCQRTTLQRERTRSKGSCRRGGAF